MKKIISLMMAIVLSLALIGCGVSYDNAKEDFSDAEFGSGYFTIVKEWGGGFDYCYQIIYANDTKVMYFRICNSTYGSGLTPLYNADGTIQVYDGE